MIVTRAEAGQKLLNFLERRVENSAGEIHKWIRTGQVRRNSGRVKPFDRVEEGDAIRVPPFAALRLGKEGSQEQETSTRSCPAANGERRETGGFSAGLGVSIVFEDDNILVIDKPAGLPTQGGTGHTDSVAARLARSFAMADFAPAPAHRLDKDTSGLLVIGKTYATLRALTDALAGRAGESPRKEYLTWVRGDWPYTEERELHDMLEKDEEARRMRVRADAGTGRESRCLVRPLETRRRGGDVFTLLLVCLLTGRTHQIRVQLASRGFPVVGDPLYGPREPRKGAGQHDTNRIATGLLLHAARLFLPALPDGNEAPRYFACPPPWTSPWTSPWSLPVSLPMGSSAASYARD